jgi:NAD(P)-dependent dehydrogenase (short-subunit alcohol dehydrogenase family)
MGRVEGKVAIVTGGSSSVGLGFAAARALAREGASVVMTGTNDAAITARGAELRAAGFRGFGMRQDVTQEEDWCQVISRTIEAYGRLDILVNNAGITLRNPISDMALETWERVMDVNLTGAFLGSKHAIAVMRRQGTGGSLINVASTGGLVGFPKGAAYASSKGGMRQLSKVIAVECAKQGIRCNCVFPGVVVTDIYKPLLEENPRHFDPHLALIPMARLGEPDEVAGCILFLASDESNFVTGAELVVDGGLTSV